MAELNPSLLLWIKQNSTLLYNICRDYLKHEAEAEEEIKKITGETGGEFLFQQFGLDPKEGKNLFTEKKQNIEHFMRLLKEEEKQK